MLCGLRVVWLTYKVTTVDSYIFTPYNCLNQFHILKNVGDVLVIMILAIPLMSFYSYVFGSEPGSRLYLSLKILPCPLLLKLENDGFSRNRGQAFEHTGLTRSTRKKR
jgi:hypothetical protein